MTVHGSTLRTSFAIKLANEFQGMLLRQSLDQPTVALGAIDRGIDDTPMAVTVANGAIAGPFSFVNLCLLKEEPPIKAQGSVAVRNDNEADDIAPISWRRRLSDEHA